MNVLLQLWALCCLAVTLALPVQEVAQESAQEVNREKRSPGGWSSPPEGVWKKKIVWKKVWKTEKKLVWQQEWKKEKVPAWKTEKVAQWKEEQVPAWKTVKKPIWKEVQVPIWKEVQVPDWKKVSKPVWKEIKVPVTKEIQVSGRHFMIYRYKGYTRNAFLNSSTELIL